MVMLQSTAPIDQTLRRILGRSQGGGPLEPGHARLLDALSVETDPECILHLGGMGRARTGLCRTFPRAVVHGAEELTPGLSSLGCDTLVAGYYLSRQNPGYEDALDRMWDLLPPGGTIAVVDYHDAGSDRFATYMGHVHHVRMAGHLVPALRERFLPLHIGLFVPMMSVWRTFCFIGRKV